MTHTTIQIDTQDGVCPTHLFQPDGDGPWPGVLFYMDGIGIRPALFDMGERMASAGPDQLDMNELFSLSLIDAVRRLTSGEITSEAYTRSLLSRVDMLEPRVQAFQYLDKERALELAEMKSEPVAIARAGISRGCGSR